MIEYKKLKIEFLGTCACDFSDKLENEFKNSFDYDARRSSSILIQDRILVDCGTHTLDSLRILGKSLDEITDLLITHFHEDHFDLDTIKALAKQKKEPLKLWVNDGINLEPIENVDIFPMSYFKEYDFQYGSVIGVPANHDFDAHPQHFSFKINGKKIFYGCDGAWLLNNTYNFLCGSQFDLVVLDCTVGDYVGDYRLCEHNSIPMIRLMLPSLKAVNIINEKTRVVLSHIAPSLNKPHAEMCKIASELGAILAYDGLKLLI